MGKESVPVNRTINEGSSSSTNFVIEVVAAVSRVTAVSIIRMNPLLPTNPLLPDNPHAYTHAHARTFSTLGKKPTAISVDA